MCKDKRRKCLPICCCTGSPSARCVLTIMVFWAQITNYILRVGINIAIVSMVASDSRGNSSETAVACGVDTGHRYYYPPTENNTSTISNYSQLAENITRTQFQKEGLPWDQYTQGLILGSFAWGYCLTQIIGGRMAEIYGTKRIYSYGLLVASLLNCVIPSAAKFDYRALVAVIALIGFFEGPTWPSLNVITARWIPPQERGRFSGSFLGTLLGVVIAYPLSGVIIYYLQWEYTFYIYGILGIIWFIFWQLLVFDTPDHHPRISEDEKHFIHESMGREMVQRNVIPIPWKSLLTSVPFIAIVTFEFCNVWGFVLMLSKIPTFMKEILGFNIKENGVISAVPSLCRFFGAQLFGYLADWILRKEYLNRTRTRKLCIILAGYFPAICLIGISFVDCNATLAVTLLAAAFGFNGAIIPGIITNEIDIAPNFAGTVSGASSPILAIAAFLAPVVIGLIINENQTMHQWRIVFFMVAGIYTSGATVYCILGSAEVQKWNYPKPSTSQEDEEDIPLQTTA